MRPFTLICLAFAGISPARGTTADPLGEACQTRHRPAVAVLGRAVILSTPTQEGSSMARFSRRRVLTVAFVGLLLVGSAAVASAQSCP